MWTRVTCLVLLLSACVTLGWEFHSRSSLTAPLFMWSDKQILTTTQVADTVSSDYLSDALASLFGVDSEINYLNKNAAPEVVIMFIEPEMRTDEVSQLASAFASTPGGSLSNIKKAIESSASSVVMPYTTVDESSWFNAFHDIMNQCNTNKASFFMTESRANLYFRLRGYNSVKTVAVDGLLAELRSSNSFSNGVTDFVVVTFDSTAFAEHDVLIGKLVSSISAATKGNYVAVYTANMPSVSDLKWSFSELSVLEFQNTVSVISLTDDNNGTNGSNSSTPAPFNPNKNGTRHHKINYFPGPFIEVLLICAVLLTMLFTGACAIFSLQTPDKWEIPKVKRDL